MEQRDSPLPRTSEGMFESSHSREERESFLLKTAGVSSVMNLSGVSVPLAGTDLAWALPRGREESDLSSGSSTVRSEREVAAEKFN